MNSFGLVRAIVTDNKDPDKLGRIKIRYPWLGENAGNKETIWARLSRGISHAGSGDWFLPQVGDEVLVGFEFGKTEHPVILGGLYSKDSQPPKSGKAGDLNENGKNNLRFLKTKAGHLFIFDDLPGSESISLIDKNSNQIVLDSAQQKITIKDQSGNQVVLENSGIKIQSAKKVVIEASSAIELGEGASEALVKGNAFMAFFNAHVHPAPGGTSGPPQAPMTPGQLSMKVKTV